jgi:SAM-dependent methyltransferase
MHQTAMMNGKLFFDCYSKNFIQGKKTTVIEIGSQDVNGSLKDVCPSYFNYIGVDFVSAKNVDVVLTDPYLLPFESNSIDIVVSSSCLEHSEMFWLVFLEVLRVLKPNGLFYINAPSRGPFHRYPVDCWRFYPDSGNALNKWANRSGFDSLMLESFIQKNGEWGDFVAVFLKDAKFINSYPDKIITSKSDFVNGRNDKSDKILKFSSTDNLSFLGKFRMLIPDFIKRLLKKA